MASDVASTMQQVDGLISSIDGDSACSLSYSFLPVWLWSQVTYHHADLFIYLHWQIRGMLPLTIHAPTDDVACCLAVVWLVPFKGTKSVKPEQIYYVVRKLEFQ
ncbi:hypothetical protein RB195_025400 [Necator americanus]|uniref:Uncharacterized protein n=1 Tax=Necator americanus TaxID=51031 RepID=A0ABR1EUD8_NECAM